VLATVLIRPTLLALFRVECRIPSRMRVVATTTLSRGVRRCGLRQARYIGLAKTRLQHILIAVALNVVRIGEWLLGLTRARTRVSPFARLTAATG
jgi:hypothetical protein